MRISSLYYKLILMIKLFISFKFLYITNMNIKHVLRFLHAYFEEMRHFDATKHLNSIRRIVLQKLQITQDLLYLITQCKQRSIRIDTLILMTC